MKLRARIADAQRSIRLRITRKYWNTTDIGDHRHHHPNRDTLKHEATDCPCGPTPELMQCDGDMWIMTHHSLDGREAHE